jgi:hypothetical protein
MKYLNRIGCYIFPLRHYNSLCMSTTLSYHGIQHPFLLLYPQLRAHLGGDGIASQANRFAKLLLVTKLSLFFKNY